MTGRETKRMNRYMGIPKTLRALLVATLGTVSGLLAVPAAIAADAPANKLQSVEQHLSERLRPGLGAASSRQPASHHFASLCAKIQLLSKKWLMSSIYLPMNNTTC